MAASNHADAVLWRANPTAGDRSCRRPCAPYQFWDEQSDHNPNIL